ncbi:hypothetical protein [uncultured Roseobacter sp.]|uniref:hypothetical protein n=1 Tax=uncultured Roseobacter sp. TaxID=114847 RepID=UPI00261DD89E|nr:hypothetical protein [uncultured Roseobacter sp.]
MTIKGIALAVTLAAVTATSGFAATVTLNVAGGDLLRPSNISVSETFCDVDFIDGSYAGFVDGCEDTSDFVFWTASKAGAAVTILLSSVFVDGLLGNFNAPPELKRGIERRVGGEFQIPCARPWFFVTVISLSSSASAATDQVFEAWSSSIQGGRSFDAGDRYARFTQSAASLGPLPAYRVVALASFDSLGVSRSRRIAAAAGWIQ